MSGRTKAKRVRGRTGFSPTVEGMESRRLLAVSLSSFSVPTANSGLIGITGGPDGNLWFTEFSAGKIGSINASTKVVTEYSTPTANSQPYAIVTGPDGNMWFTEFASGKIGTINLATKAITEFDIGLSAGPQNIVTGPDGNMWFTDPPTNQVGTLNVSTHVVTEFVVPPPAGAPAGSNVFPSGIISGSDGNLWFTDSNTDRIGSINPASHTINQYSIPSSTYTPSNGVSSAQPHSITNGPDGNLWFTESQSGKIGTLNPTTKVITEFALPAFFSRPEVITTGPDGNLLFAEAGIAKLGMINPSTKVITETAVFGGGSNNPFWVTVGPDNAVWFTYGDPANRQIGQAQTIPTNQTTVSGTVTFDAAANGQGGGISGRTVYLDLNNNGTLDPGEPASITNSAGYYAFNGLAPGSYTVTTVSYPGDLSTGAGTTQTIQAAGGQIGNDSFGFVPTTVISPVTFNATPFGTHNVDIYTAEIRGLYHLILNRDADPSGLANGVATLKRGIPLQQVVVGFFYSPEYQTRVVAGYYQSYLSRTGSQAEVNAGVSVLQGGQNQEQLAAYFLTSAEFNARHSDNSDFVRTAYQTILGRAASVGEVSAIAGAISSGTSRTAIIGSLLNSTEAATRSANGYYGVFLARPGDRIGLAAAVNNLQKGLSKNFDIAAFLAGSAEFTARAQTTVG